MSAFIIYQTGMTPHMANLSRALAEAGHEASYVSRLAVDEERARQGWTLPDCTGVQLVDLNIDSRAIAEIPLKFPKDAIHLTQGICRNGHIQKVQPTLARHRLRWGAMLETIDDRGMRGLMRRLDYARRLRWGNCIPDFLLATGERTADWLVARGFPSKRVFPFTYFLQPASKKNDFTPKQTPTIGFVGRMISLKRVDLLIEAMATLGRDDMSLSLVGDGPLGASLRARAVKALGKSRVDWRGRCSIEEARAVMASLDLLVLPSRHDGWGAVVTEALLAGTPAICSDACGAAEAVRASGLGGVFKSGDIDSLRHILRRSLDTLPRTRAIRAQIAAWAHSSFSIQAGARYLDAIVRHLYGGAPRPLPPWRNHRPTFTSIDGNQ